MLLPLQALQAGKPNRDSKPKELKNTSEQKTNKTHSKTERQNKRQTKEAHLKQQKRWQIRTPEKKKKKVRQSNWSWYSLRLETSHKSIQNYDGNHSTTGFAVCIFWWMWADVGLSHTISICSSQTHTHIQATSEPKWRSRPRCMSKPRSPPKKIGKKLGCTCFWALKDSKEAPGNSRLHTDAIMQYSYHGWMVNWLLQRIQSLHPSLHPASPLKQAGRHANHRWSAFCARFAQSATFAILAHLVA